MTNSKIFLCFCLAFTCGIFLSSILADKLGFFIMRIVQYAGLIFGLILVSVLFKYKRFAVIGFSVLFLVLGIWRHGNVVWGIANNELKNFNDAREKITLVGIVSGEPEIGAGNIKLVIDSQQLIFNNGNIGISGKILVTTNRYPDYKYGDKLKIVGNLKTPSDDVEGFNYRDYLLKDGIYSVMAWPGIELISESQGNVFYEYLFSFKGKLKESINKAMSPPQSALLEALFFGDEENISKEWKNKFNLTGTRHITAVSGMNITIICFLILNFLLILGFWRNQAFYISVILIILYILMVGAPASAVRAGIMGLLFLAGQHFGRASTASRAIAFASTFMLALNPLLLKLDVGFQLSFLAVMGLIYLQPMFLELFKKIPNNFQIRYSLAATISAQIFTLPVLIYNFGRIPITSPLTNVLIVPFLSLITILGFAFAFLGIIIPLFGQILSWPAWLFLTYITETIDFFSRIEFVSISVTNISWFWLVTFYLILGFVIWRIQGRQKLKFLQY
ncbi:MAG: ComEC/Rec2 family competence protein [Patescibacteria group bacterium]